MAWVAVSGSNHGENLFFGRVTGERIFGISVKQAVDDRLTWDVLKGTTVPDYTGSP